MEILIYTELNYQILNKGNICVMPTLLVSQGLVVYHHSHLRLRYMEAHVCFQNHLNIGKFSSVQLLSYV